MIDRVLVTKPRSNRIDALQKQIKWIENHIHGSDSNNAKTYDLKQIKAELAGLLEEEEAKANTSRRLLLHNCRITGFKFA